MKRILLAASAFILTLSSMQGQEFMDAHKLSQSELTGTARAMSMGGAFGALGGDVTGIAINPAGIGVYKSSEIVATLNFQNIETKSELNIGSLKESKFKVNFNNLAFVSTFPLYNDVAPYINVGFSYNKLKSFDRKYSVQGDNMSSSLADYFALMAGDQASNFLNGENGNPWKAGTSDWMGALGYQGYLITPENDHYVSSLPNGTIVNSDLLTREKGSVNTYDFNLGTTFADMLSVGMTVSVTDINYRSYSSYYEHYLIDGVNATDGNSFGLHNSLKSDGTGWKLGLGVIFKPIQELRIGIAYHSPTWYHMTDYYYSTLDHDFSKIINQMDLTVEEQNKYESNSVLSDDNRVSVTDYKLRTPDKWVFSLAGVIGKNAILSLDYELVDYGKAKFDNRGGDWYSDFTAQNADVKKSYKLTSTIRLGGEYRFTPQFSGRIGYAWQQNPYEDKFKGFLEDRQFADLIYTHKSQPHYIAYGDTHHITWGLGYRFTKNIYTDLAFVYKTQKSDLYMYSKSDKATIKENDFYGALTLGFRF